jgi:predicted DNA-binding protein with PD1-like motif
VRLNEHVELLSSIGDVAIKDSEPHIHAHLSQASRWHREWWSPAWRDSSTGM